MNPNESTIMQKNSLNEVKKIHFITALAIAASLFSAWLYLSKIERTSDLLNVIKPDSAIPFGEIVAGAQISQEVRFTTNDVDLCEVQFANYNNRANSGFVRIDVTSDGELIGSTKRNVATIGDGEFVKVELTRRALAGASMAINIVGIDGIAGSCVTTWMSEINKSQLTALTIEEIKIDGKSNGRSLHLKLKSHPYKINFLWIIALTIFISLFLKARTGLNLILINASKFKLIGLLIISGFIILTLRDSSYLTLPIIYAEDGGYVSKILHQGFLSSAFSTRSGSVCDFYNLGLYCLLGLSLLSCKLFNGHDLTNLPLFIGIWSNLFVSGVALVAFCAFHRHGRIYSFIAWISFLTMSVNLSSSEIFGRVLNLGFIFPVLASCLVVLRLDTEKYILRTSIDILLIICCLSFPVCFSVIACAILLDLIHHFKSTNSPIPFFLKRNIILLPTLGFGILLVKNGMLGSKGIAVAYTTNYDNIINFAIGRHILYGIIAPFYHYINDLIAIIIASFFLAGLSALFYFKLKNNKLRESKCFTWFILGMAVIAPSIAMRFSMTQIFTDYNQTYPDRYYYGCNVMAFFIVLSFLLDLPRFRNIDISSAILIPLVTLLFLNSNLINVNKGMMLYSDEYNGSFSNCVYKSTRVRLGMNSPITKDTSVDILIYPVSKSPGSSSVNGVYMSLPIKYAIATSLNSQNSQ